MITVHIRNTVRDFDTWKANFDKYEAFRAAQGVQAYRVRRSLSEPNAVLIDLDFEEESVAEQFLPKLAQVMASPQAQEQLVSHGQPELYALVTDAVPAG
jgi:hypothetical protein